MTPTDPARYTGVDLRLAAVDMDGTLLDDDKNFPPGMDELLDQMDARGVTFAPASGRQVWTLIDMFPGRPGMTVIGENGGIVMRDGVEVSSSPLDAPTMREAVRLVREATSGPDGIDGGQAQVGARVKRGVSGGHHGSIVPDGRHGCLRPTTRPGQPHVTS